MPHLTPILTLGWLALLATNASAQPPTPTTRPPGTSGTSGTSGSSGSSGSPGSSGSSGSSGTTETQPAPVPIAPLDRAGLQRGLRRLLRGAAANDGTVAIAVKELGAKDAIFVRRGRKALHPASCVKLLTAAAVLRRLGTEARLDTRLHGLAAGTTLVTPLYVHGSGDPSVTREDLQTFAAALADRGVAAVPRGIVVDDHYFDGKRWAPGFDPRVAEGYAAPTGATSVQGNVVEVRVTPAQRVGQVAKVEVLPDSDYLRLSGKVRTTARGLSFWAHAARLRARVDRPGQRGRPERLRVVARGRIGVANEPRSRWVRVMSPARFFGESLKRALQDAGVLVGPVVRGRLPGPQDVRRPPVMHLHRSAPLAALVKTMNEHSSNFYAEQLLKVLGARAAGAPGTTAKGLAEARRQMTALGIDARRYRQANGSGLWGKTRLTVRVLVDLLESVRAHPGLHQALGASLAVWGRTGTLERRAPRSVNVGRVRAKTGTLKDVSCLAGYVDGKLSSRPLVFAILHNGFTRGLFAVRKLQQRATELMVRYTHSRYSNSPSRDGDRRRRGRLRRRRGAGRGDR